MKLVILLPLSTVPSVDTPETAKQIVGGTDKTHSLSPAYALYVEEWVTYMFHVIPNIQWCLKFVRPFAFLMFWHKNGLKHDLFSTQS